MYRASVIIPVYNAEKTLARCVESILYGRERNVEILLIDDCSKDDSWELCCAYAEKYDNVRAFRNEENRGVSYTRNRGLDEAMGEYILFVDSDDWVSDSYADMLCKTNSQYPGALVMCAYLRVNDEQGRDTDAVQCSDTNETTAIEQQKMFALLDLELIHYVWNKVFVRKVVKEHRLRFDESQYMGEDFQFVLDYYRALKATNCIVLNGLLYYYSRYIPESLVSRWSDIGNLKQAVCRIEQMAVITGDRETCCRKIDELKDSFVYLIARDKRLTRTQRIERIEMVLGDGEAANHYGYQRWMYTKERIAAWISKLWK